MEGSETPGSETAETSVEQPAAAPSFDASAFESRFDDLHGEIGKLAETVQGIAQPPDDEPAEDNWLTTGFDNEVDPEAEQAAALARFQQTLDSRMQSEIQKAIEQATSPLQERINRFEQETGIAELEAEFPELAESEEVASATMEYAEQLAAQFGANASDPNILRTAYLAMRGAQAGQSEVPAGQQPPVSLESGSGAQPPRTEVDERDAIVNAGGQYGALYS